MTDVATSEQKMLRRNAVLQFLIVLVAGNLVWEIGQMPLYTLWLTGTVKEVAYAILHCTVGDVLIACASLAVALKLFGGPDWPRTRFRVVAFAMITIALSYTLFSEWWNTEIRQAWAYRDIMPRLPIIGTGLSPVLQWLAVPALGFLRVSYLYRQ